LQAEGERRFVSACSREGPDAQLAARRASSSPLVLQTAESRIETPGETWTLPFSSCTNELMNKGALPLPFHFRGRARSERRKAILRVQEARIQMAPLVCADGKAVRCLIASLAAPGSQGKARLAHASPKGLFRLDRHIVDTLNGERACARHHVQFLQRRHPSGRWQSRKRSRPQQGRGSNDYDKSNRNGKYDGAHVKNLHFCAMCRSEAGEVLLRVKSGLVNNKSEGQRTDCTPTLGKDSGCFWDPACLLPARIEEYFGPSNPARAIESFADETPHRLMPRAGSSNRRPRAHILA
jgi:hypothetical protein